MINVTCAIIYNQGKILVTQRSIKMKLPLKWEFPGGKLEPFENEKDCIKREIREELGIEIEIIGKLENSTFNYDTFSINLIPFIANYKSGIIQLSEHASYKWVTIDEMQEIDFAAADIPLIDQIKNRKT